ncbi:hypothetical protein [Pseudoalteromonas denitrificans]|uniref:Uncharacterized protein n=1 Tax=Pseudoalteromonas denitrificans DSM 6059 TaxID=1123010 RepID=A0A1I1U4Z2_9GAMM|nr:hypothetical protein [Pseudoalteromonas denitrificans]SFD65839.1 hypothetical protein SAMN02745724_05116 [Pseudoalteromonas denitrificans DSM 6059]
MGSPKVTAVEKTHTDKLNTSINRSVLLEIESLIKNLFILGDWRYHSSKSIGNMVHIYIQIPTPLKMRSSYQKNYIKQSICPKTINPVWQLINPEQMKFHLFIINNKRKSISTTCD